jgi:hypothetical protein
MEGLDVGTSPKDMIRTITRFLLTSLNGKRDLSLGQEFIELQGKFEREIFSPSQFISYVNSY